MTRYPASTIKVFSTHHIKMQANFLILALSIPRGCQPGREMTCLYASLFCIPAMNVTDQFALSLAEGYNRYGYPQIRDSERSSSLLHFGERMKKWW